MSEKKHHCHQSQVKERVTMEHEQNIWEGEHILSFPSSKTKKQWIDEGNHYYQTGLFQEALIAFDQAIQADPDDSSIYTKKAQALIKLGQSKEALAVAKQGATIKADRDEKVQHKSLWQPVALYEGIYDFMLGFSLPENQEIVVISEAGLHLLPLNTPGMMLSDYANPAGGDVYDQDEQQLQYQKTTFIILGANGGHPLLTSPLGESLFLDTEHGMFTVQNKNGENVCEYHFGSLSPTWIWLTFSSDFRFILLGWRGISAGISRGELRVYRRATSDQQDMLKPETPSLLTRLSETWSQQGERTSSQEQADKWRRKRLPSLYGYERILGFSVIKENLLVIIHSGGLRIFNLSNTDMVLDDGRYPDGEKVYDQEQHILLYGGRAFQILARNRQESNHPLLLNQYGEQLRLDDEKHALLVLRLAGDPAFEYTFDTDLLDWIQATFSQDGNFLVLGTTYDIHIFERLEIPAEG